MKRCNRPAGLVYCSSQPTKESSMITLLLAFLLSTPLNIPQAQVTVGTPEAVFVPAGWTGPVVAAPFDEPAFEVNGE